eukprot:1294549-Rhodomonas_salina.2
MLRPAYACATQCPISSQRIVQLQHTRLLRAIRYRDSVWCGISIHATYAMSGTEIAYGGSVGTHHAPDPPASGHPIVLRLRYALSSTELPRTQYHALTLSTTCLLSVGYAATALLFTVQY